MHRISSISKAEGVDLTKDGTLTMSSAIIQDLFTHGKLIADRRWRGVWPGMQVPGPALPARIVSLGLAGFLSPGSAWRAVEMAIPFAPAVNKERFKQGSGAKMNAASRPPAVMQTVGTAGSGVNG
ncbi:MAG: hypothetical protein HY526_03685 [Betaproteobacteria bacterium]|nr:hypothetical protein [Betaproteobacteria bacterium]